MLIVYCDNCDLRILQKDMESGGVVQVAENKYLCPKCAPLQQAKPPSGRSPASSPVSADSPVVRPASGEVRQSRATIRLPKPGERASAAMTRPESAAMRAPAAGAGPAPGGAKKNNLIIIGAGVGVLLIIAGILIFGASSPPPAQKVAQASPANASGSKPPPSAIDLAKNAEKTEGVKLAEAADKASNSDERKKNLPSWMREAAQDPEKPGARRAAQLSEVPALPPPEAQRTQGNETIFFDDALPKGAIAKGTMGDKSWKWVGAPEHPVFSGKFSHTYAGAVTNPRDQHYFDSASPPLSVGPNDTLFVYAYLDPKSTPREIMMQWSFKTFEHRAYWGEDLIPLGTNFSPSRLPMGPLPKAGEWVRLEVLASQIGVQSDNELLHGWAFNQSDGVVYWDKAGIVRGPKPDVALKTPPSTPTPPPAQTPPPAPVPASGGLALASSTLALRSNDYAQLARVSCTQMTGGGDYDNFLGKGGKSKAIWAKNTPQNTLTATFTLPENRYADGLLIVRSLRHGRKDPCRLGLVLNGQEIFNGVDPAKDNQAFYDHKFSIPTGILKGGANELKIQNLEESGPPGGDPWYMVQSVEVFGALLREFPPIVSDFQRAQMKTYEQAFELLLKKDVDVAGRLETIIRMNTSTPAAANVFAAAEAKEKGEPSLKLFPAVERALELHVQSLENFRKKPPAEQVKVEKLKASGTISRVDGSKVFVKAGGIEMSLDITALPNTLFLKALALDETKPAGLGDKAAWLLGQGNVEEAQAVLKKLKKEERPEWAGMFSEYAALDRLMKFETAVQSLDLSIKHGKLDTAQIVLNNLKKEYPEFIDANKERFDYLAARVEKKK
ncbi:MAG TPA: hypothetical protein VEK08_22275 [Planctomycetota bacterium]|nr:hypothetical protein [Planctomycetota bacterium]